MARGYQSRKRGVNVRAVRWTFLALIISVRGAVAAAETVDYRTSDGVEIVADLLVPPEYHQAMVLFHRDGDDASELAALPAALEAEGFAVLVPDRRGHGRSGAPERPIRQSDNAAWLRDGPAAVAFLHETHIAPPST